jgi:hypothetical protein
MKKRGGDQGEGRLFNILNRNNLEKEEGGGSE